MLEGGQDKIIVSGDEPNESMRLPGDLVSQPFVFYAVVVAPLAKVALICVY